MNTRYSHPRWGIAIALITLLLALAGCISDPDRTYRVEGKVTMDGQPATALEGCRVILPYPAFAIIGTVLWAIFAESLTAPLSAVAASSSMLAKVNFPREALLLSAMGQLLFGMAIKLSIVAVVFAYYQLPLSWTLLPALGAVLLLMLLGFVIGLFLMPLGTLYTDVSSALTAILGLWFFLTPVVYPPPQQWPYSLLAMLNPVSPLLAGARELATQGTLSNPLAFAVVALLTVLGFFVVWVLYRISLPILVERMHA